MIRTQANLKALIKSFPVPSEDKLTRHILRLERMRHFYEEKIPEAPEKQGLMFTGFVSALVYAITMIKMYGKLTEKLTVLSKGVTDEPDDL